jgi:hypothetical protein
MYIGFLRPVKPDKPRSSPCCLRRLPQPFNLIKVTQTGSGERPRTPQIERHLNFACLPRGSPIFYWGFASPLPPDLVVLLTRIPSQHSLIPAQLKPSAFCRRGCGHHGCSKLSYLRTNRTSTAATPAPCARTMMGLISMSDKWFRCAAKISDRPTIAFTNDSMSCGACPRTPSSTL